MDRPEAQSRRRIIANGVFAGALLVSLVLWFHLARLVVDVVSAREMRTAAAVELMGLVSLVAVVHAYLFSRIEHWSHERLYAGRQQGSRGNAGRAGEGA